MNILRCPWCHANAHITACNLIVSGNPLAGGRVACGNAACGACGPARLSADEAVRAWNTLRVLVLTVETVVSSDWLNPMHELALALAALEEVGHVPSVSMGEIEDRLEGGV